MLDSRSVALDTFDGKPVHVLGSKIDDLVAIGDQTIKVVQSDPSSGSRFAEGSTVEVSLPHFGVQILGMMIRH
jgi:hypothetical protein